MSHPFSTTLLRTKSFRKNNLLSTELLALKRSPLLLVRFSLKFENLQAKLLLQVHDELIFEAPEEEIKILEKIVPEVMEHALELEVPLKVDYSYGKTWYEAK